MVDVADGEPVSCFSCLVGDDWFKDLNARIAAAIHVPLKFLGLG